MYVLSLYDFFVFCNVVVFFWIVMFCVVLIFVWRNFYLSVEYLVYFVILMLKLGFECKFNMVIEDIENRVMF